MVERVRLSLLAAAITLAVCLAFLAYQQIAEALNLNWKIPVYLALVVGVGFFLIDLLTEPWGPEEEEEGE